MRLIAFVSILVVGPLVPAAVAHATPPFPGITGIAAGGDHTCGITAANTAVCWGNNNPNGELGNGTTVNATTPQAVSTAPPSAGHPGMTGAVTSLALGFHHTCAITAGVAWCWGLNDHGEVGNGHSQLTGGRLTPDTVEGLGGVTPTQLAGGGQHTCALLSTGAVKCWGRNDKGQLGDGAAGDSESSFSAVQVTGLTTGVAQIAAAQKHTCALVTNGAATGGVVCWGDNTNGAIGDGTAGIGMFRKVPTAVSGLSAGVSQIAVGGDHVCALVTNGAASGGVKCWGLNASGQIGNNTTTTASTPVDVTGMTTNVIAIAAGGSDTCAITLIHALKCWGANGNGQLGDETTTNRPSVIQVHTGGIAVSQIAMGRAHNCLTSDSGASKCWGAAARGQMGDGSTVDLHGPFLPDPPQPPTVVGGDTEATVTWTAPSSDFGFDIQAYKVVASPGGAIMNVDGSTLSTTYTGLHNGTAYTFVVRASNVIGAGAFSLASSPVVPAGLPGAPSALSVSTSDAAATVAWHAASGNGAAPTSNRVTVSPGGRVITTSGSATKALISGLRNGTTYTFNVRATNRVGSGPSASITHKLPIPKSGYWMLGANGSVYGFGNSLAMGSASYPSWPTGVAAVAIAPRRDGKGYWVVDSAGGVHAFGGATFYGDHPGLRAGERVSSISATPTSHGYYLFTNRGRAVAYGDAKFLGDMSKVPLNGPVIASNATPTGRGYFMVASDGGVFSFGDARFHGSTGGLRLNKPVVGLSPTPSNGGYWLVASDGGVFAFGDAMFRGSMGGVHLNKAVNGLVPLGNGYMMVASDGGVFNFSNKPFYGSLAAHPPPSPIIGIAAFVF